MRGVRRGSRAAAMMRGLGSVQQATASFYGDRPGDASFPVLPMRDIPAIRTAPDGSTWLNKAKDAQKWFYLGAEAFPLAIGANGRAVTSWVAPPEENLRGDLEIVKLMSTQDGDFAVELTHASTNRQLMNAPVFHEFVFGTSQLPATMFETLVLETTTPLNIVAQDLSGAPNNVNLVCAGRRFLDWGRGIDREAFLRSYYTRRTHPYWLTFDDGPQFALNAGQAVEVVATVPGRADFECWQMMTQATGTYNIELLEGRSARAIQSQAFDAASFIASPSVAVAGFPGGRVRASGFPFVLSFTHMWKRNTRVRIRLTDTSGAPNTVRFAMHGRLVYYDEVEPYAPNVNRGQSLPPVQGRRPVPPARGNMPYPGQLP